jgi:hemerythrin-like domain-containing protein
MTTRLPLTSITLPGHQSPGAGFEEPFEMLSACHERALRMLGLLARLREHLASVGWDASAAQAARDVMRYFDLAAPLHHEDEELHVFPVILADPASPLYDLVRRLQREHVAVAANWAVARLVLVRVCDAQPDTWQPLSASEQAALDRFVTLYEQHAEDEDRLVFPAARKQLNSPQTHAMGTEMMNRRRT